MSKEPGSFKQFLARKNVVFSAKRYGIDALGAMAQGLFASLLMGTILSTLGQQIGFELLVTIGDYAKGICGPAMAVSIGYALQAPPLVLFSLLAVGNAANTLGGAGGPLAVLVVTIFAAECGKMVSKETKIDILVTPLVTILVGSLLSIWWAIDTLARIRQEKKLNSERKPWLDELLGDKTQKIHFVVICAAVLIYGAFLGFFRL